MLQSEREDERTTRGGNRVYCDFADCLLELLASYQTMPRSSRSLLSTLLSLVVATLAIVLAMVMGHGHGSGIRVRQRYVRGLLRAVLCLVKALLRESEDAGRSSDTDDDDDDEDGADSDDGDVEFESL